MQITTSRNMASFFHNQWDVGTNHEIFSRISNSMEEIRLNFHRKNLLPSWEPYTADMFNTLNWATTTKIAVIGATFGMLEEFLRANHSVTNVVSCDDSIWIQGAKGQNEEADICASIAGHGSDAFNSAGLAVRGEMLDGDGTRARYPIYDQNGLTTASRNTIRQLLGNGIDVFFTDDLMDYLTDAEAQALSQELNKETGATVVHSVGPAGGASRINAKGSTGWDTLLPADVWIDWSTLQVT